MGCRLMLRDGISEHLPLGMQLHGVSLFSQLLASYAAWKSWPIHGRCGNLVSCNNHVSFSSLLSSLIVPNPGIKVVKTKINHSWKLIHWCWVDMVPVYLLRLLSQSLFFLSQFVFVRIKLSFDTANKALLMYLYFIFWIHSTLSYVHNCLYLLLNCNSDPWE